MIPGILLGITLALVSGCTWRRTLLITAMSMLGMSFGGSQTIGQTVGHTKDDLKTYNIPQMQQIQVALIPKDSDDDRTALKKAIANAQDFDVKFSTYTDENSGQIILLCQDEAHFYRVIERLQRSVQFDMYTVGREPQDISYKSEYMVFSQYFSTLLKFIIYIIAFLFIWFMSERWWPKWNTVFRIFLILISISVLVHYLIQPVLGLNYERIPTRELLHWWGLLGLAIKGGLWMGMPGILIGMAASKMNYSVKEIFFLLLGALLVGVIGINLLNRPLLISQGIFPPIYFSRWWDMKPRTESWAGLWFAFIFFLLYAKYVKKDINAFKMGLWGILAGQGWWVANYIQVWGHFTPLWDGTIMINWWGYMEIGFGLIAGAIFGIGWRQMDKNIDDPKTATQSKKLIPIALTLLLASWILIEFLAEEKVLNLTWFGWTLWTNWWYTILMILLTTIAWMNERWQLSIILIYSAWISTTNVGLKLVVEGLIPLSTLVVISILVVLVMSLLTRQFFKKPTSGKKIFLVLLWMHMVFFWLKHYPLTIINIPSSVKEAHGFWYWWYLGGSNSPLHIVMIIMMILLLLWMRSVNGIEKVSS